MDVEQNHQVIPVIRQDSDVTAIPEPNATVAMEWDQFIDELLPDAPDSSKFTKLDFVSPSFVVDTFIEKRKDESLEQLQQLLTTYASRIRAASVAIIDEDYLDLIHLSSNVIGVGKSVDTVLQPLTRAHSDVLSVRSEISLMMQSLEEKMQQLRQVRRIKSDTEKMIRLDDRIRELEQRLPLVRLPAKGLSAPSASDPVATLIAAEHLKADLLEVERTLKSITSKSQLFFNLKDRFSRIVFEVDRIHMN